MEVCWTRGRVGGKWTDDAFGTLKCRAHEEVEKFGTTVQNSCSINLLVRKPDEVRGVNYRKLAAGAPKRLAVHRGFKCRGCGLDPILGDRIQCMECKKVAVTFCKSCNPKRFGHDHHVFEKIKKPVANPLQVILDVLKVKPHPMEAIYNYIMVSPGGK